MVVLFLFGAHYLRYQQNIVLEKDGYQIIKIDKSQTILPHKEPIVFIIETESNEKEIYKFNGYEHEDFSVTNLYYYKPKQSNLDNDFYFIEGFKNNLPFDKKLEDLSFEQLYDIVNSGKHFESRQLIQHNLEPGIFGYIDTMPLIFMALGFVALIILKVVDVIKFLLNKVFKNKKAEVILTMLLLIFFIFLLTNIRLAPWYPTSKIALFIRNMIVIIPIFIGLRVVKNRFFKTDKFWKNQFINFIIIFLCGYLLLCLGNHIAFLIDKSNFAKISHKPFFCTHDSLAIGFLMAFAIGLILNNLINELIVVRSITE